MHNNKISDFLIIYYELLLWNKQLRMHTKIENVFMTHTKTQTHLYYNIYLTNALKFYILQCSIQNSRFDLKNQILVNVLSH